MNVFLYFVGGGGGGGGDDYETDEARNYLRYHFHFKFL